MLRTHDPPSCASRRRPDYSRAPQDFDRARSTSFRIFPATRVTKISDLRRVLPLQEETSAILAEALENKKGSEKRKASNRELLDFRRAALVRPAISQSRELSRQSRSIGLWRRVRHIRDSRGCATGRGPLRGRRVPWLRTRPLDVGVVVRPEGLVGGGYVLYQEAPPPRLKSQLLSTQERQKEDLPSTKSGGASPASCATVGAKSLLRTRWLTLLRRHAWTQSDKSGILMDSS